MTRPLTGRTIALAEGRQLEEMAALLENEGAATLRYPMVSILDAPEETSVNAWIEDLCAGRFAYVILMTGEALRRLLGFAERLGRREQFLAALAGTPLLSRGPKPVQVLKEFGLKATRVAPAPTTEGILTVLRGESWQEKTVGLTLYGEPNPVLEEYLVSVGATVRPVLSYVFAPAADDGRVAELIERLASGGVDVVVFTSSPQVDRLCEVAKRRGLEETLRQGWTRTCVAAVGPVVAETLRQNGAAVSICPEQGFVMKNLVQQIKRTLAG